MGSWQALTAMKRPIILQNVQSCIRSCGEATGLWGLIEWLGLLNTVYSYRPGIDNSYRIVCINHSLTRLYPSSHNVSRILTGDLIQSKPVQNLIRLGNRIVYCTGGFHQSNCRILASDQW
jgi:hypothetical protein